MRLVLGRLGFIVSLEFPYSCAFHINHHRRSHLVNVENESATWKVHAARFYAVFFARALCYWPREPLRLQKRRHKARRCAGCLCGVRGEQAVSGDRCLREKNKSEYKYTWYVFVYQRLANGNEGPHTHDAYRQDLIQHASAPEAERAHGPDGPEFVSSSSAPATADRGLLEACTSKLFSKLLGVL